jgi:hypothetical protein
MYAVHHFQHQVRRHVETLDGPMVAGRAGYFASTEPFKWRQRPHLGGRCQRGPKHLRYGLRTPDAAASTGVNTCR